MKPARNPVLNYVSTQSGPDHIAFWFNDGDREAKPLVAKSHIYVAKKHEDRTFDDTLLEDVAQTFKRMDDALFDKSHPNRIVAALKMFSTAQQQSYDVDAYVFYAACLESLLGMERDEVTYRLRSRAAWFLEPRDLVERTRMFDVIGEFYKLRSQIVHGRLDELNLSENRNARRLEVYEEIENIIRRIFSRIFRDEKLWNLFLSTKSKPHKRALKTYFKGLVLGEGYQNAH